MHLILFSAAWVCSWPWSGSPRTNDKGFLLLRDSWTMVRQAWLFPCGCQKYSFTMWKSRYGWKATGYQWEITAIIAHIVIHWVYLASISMTLCEIATGSHYSIPLECHAFTSPGPVSAQRPSPPVDAVGASRCVEWVVLAIFLFDMALFLH